MKTRHVALGCTAVLLLVALSCSGVAWLLFGDHSAANLAAGKTADGAITISEETTFLTEPLDADGYVDYIAALNAAASKDVTPENNAVVLLAQAFGPPDFHDRFRPAYFAALGIPPPVKRKRVSSITTIGSVRYCRRTLPTASRWAALLRPQRKSLPGFLTF